MPAKKLLSRSWRKSDSAYCGLSSWGQSRIFTKVVNVIGSGICKGYCPPLAPSRVPSAVVIQLRQGFDGRESTMADKSAHGRGDIILGRFTRGGGCSATLPPGYFPRPPLGSSECRAWSERGASNRF